MNNTSTCTFKTTTHLGGYIQFPKAKEMKTFHRGMLDLNGKSWQVKS